MPIVPAICAKPLKNEESSFVQWLVNTKVADVRFVDTTNAVAHFHFIILIPRKKILAFLTKDLLVLGKK